MRCQNCFLEVPDGDYCDQCGAKVSAVKKEMTPSPPPPPEVPPTLISNKLPATERYEVKKEIGRGGMSVVYEAIDHETGKKLAIKEYKEDITLSRREMDKIIRHCEMVLVLEHKNIVKTYGYYIKDGKLRVIMELVEGKTVAQLLDEKTRLLPNEAIDIIIPVCEAIGYSHANNIIHRDLKPSNIMISNDGVVKVMDFDIAKRARETIASLSNMPDTSGTPIYMAPEQHLGKYNKQTDIYSAGAVLYEMLTGEFPFTGSGADLIYQKEKNAFIRPNEISPDIPENLVNLIERCLSYEIEKRPGSFEELKNALLEIKNTIKT